MSLTIISLSSCRLVDFITVCVFFIHIFTQITTFTINHIVSLSCLDQDKASKPAKLANAPRI